VPNRAGRLPGTERLALILTEYVNVERLSGEEWTLVHQSLPSTFEPVRLAQRIELESWTQKPLFNVWLLPNVDLRDGDRLVRSDGSTWTVRGMPVEAINGSHIAALTEGATDDGLFDAPDLEL
jgi:hypothetical protein